MLVFPIEDQRGSVSKIREIKRANAFITGADYERSLVRKPEELMES